MCEWIFLPSVHSLTCQCKKYIGADLTFNSCTNYSCDATTGACYVNLKVDDKTGIYSYTYGCLEETNDHGLPSVIGCSISPTATQVILCCNTTDYCNRDLRPDLLLVQHSAMSPTSTPLATTDSGPTSGQGNILYCTCGVERKGRAFCVITFTSVLCWITATSILVWLGKKYLLHEISFLVHLW